MKLKLATLPVFTLEVLVASQAQCVSDAVFKAFHVGWLPTACFLWEHEVDVNKICN